ncbi:MAG: RNA-binding domain-containing protein [Bacteroidota bacterium]
MLKTELLEIIANGENSGVEFKRDDIRPEQLAREVVALANLNGGRVLIGVEDSGEINGIQRNNLEEWVLNAFRDKIHPQLIPFYEEVKIDNDKKVAVVSISMGLSKPYVVRHNGREDTYIRMGSRSELASREQQLRLYESGGLLHVEVMPITGTSIDDLDLERISFYLKSIIEDPEVPELNDVNGWSERLLGLGLMARDALGNKTCSVAGLVCFGFNPRQIFRQSGVRVMSFKGTDLTYKAELDTVVKGPLVARYRLKASSEPEIVDDGIIENLSQILHPFITEESDSINENMVRKKKWHYPWEAIREAVVNALIHRDWTRSVDIEICNFSDRIEIKSPGSLQNSMTIEKMKAGQRSPRNPIIVEIIKDFKYADSRGMGVRTKLIPLMRTHNGCDPLFEAAEDFLKVTLPRRKDEEAFQTKV